MTLPVYYINLASDELRRDRMELELQRIQLDGQRLDAVRWTALSDAEQQKLYSEDLNQQQFHLPLVAGEKGCYASHIKAWRMLLESQHHAFVVLEDDVRFDDRLSPVLDAINGLDFPWDMIKLIGREREKVRSRRELIQGVELVEYARVPSLTAGYVISRSGAQKLLASRVPFGRPIDVDLRFWWESDLVVLGVTPSMLILDETSLVSSIGSKADQHGKSWSVRWKKFCLKSVLTFQNWTASRRRPLLLD
mgnify:CR=1 FL=1